MDAKKCQRFLIGVIHSVLNDAKSDESFIKEITPDIAYVYYLAKKHEIGQVVSRFVYLNEVEISDGELAEALKKEELMSVYRTEQMKYDLDEICDIFDGENIDYIPLKGAVLRPFYPYESMRTSCDIDVLIRESELDNAIKALCDNGYKCGDRHYHDVSLYSPSNTHLELHFTLREDIDRIDAVLGDAWNYTTAIEKCKYGFQDSFFVFQMISHIAYHFLSGGCGIRSLMDIWVMEHKMGIDLSEADELLKRTGLDKFAKEITDLAERCFTHNDETVFSDEVFTYIVFGGAYGTVLNKISMGKKKKNSSLVYVWKRIFLPLKTMSKMYPVLNKAPVLLPLYWFVRCVQGVFGDKRKRIASEVSRLNDTSDEKIEELRAICNRLGL